MQGTGTEETQGKKENQGQGSVGGAVMVITCMRRAECCTLAAHGS